MAISGVAESAGAAQGTVYTAFGSKPAGVAASRTGIAVGPGAAAPKAVARAAAEVPADPQYAENARKTADEMGVMPAPAEVAETLAAALR
ncbi:hypothetical protein [Streptomyces montanisoli]|uniref:hypothetical protein n=1 Tax=Streptomyces montanisoli TaxID=2798581 RepID=UPI0035584EA2